MNMNPEKPNFLKKARNTLVAGLALFATNVDSVEAKPKNNNEEKKVELPQPQLKSGPTRVTREQYMKEKDESDTEERLDLEDLNSALAETEKRRRVEEFAIKASKSWDAIIKNSPESKPLPELKPPVEIDSSIAREYQEIQNFFSPIEKYIGDETEPFEGFKKMCESENYKTFCGFLNNLNTDNYNTPNLDLHLFTNIFNLNQSINNNIKPELDIDQFGVTELWRPADMKGDCEDIQLLKYFYAIFNGGGVDAKGNLLPLVHPQNMHLIGVRDEKNGGHLVLGIDVKINGEDTTIILDNKTNRIISYQEMTMKYKPFITSKLVRNYDKDDQDKWKIEWFKIKNNL